MALTQHRAQTRFSCIKQDSISYDFHINLQSGNYYSVISQLTFTLTKLPQNQLPIDLKSKQILSFIINHEQSPISYQQGFILPDISKLHLNQPNHILIYYRNKYDNDGSGLCSFIDVDQKQYLYTQFQSYFANRVLAVFDQPDLKAKMRLNIICPDKWKVLSNQYSVVEESIDKQKYMNTVRTQHKQVVQKLIQDKQGKMTIFPDTPLLPTYLFCFVAGQYKQLMLPIQQRYNNIPMSLYSIQSLYSYMQTLAPFIFEITIQSMKFFQSFFGYPYAFNKYDQIFAHEYKWGAMQNAGIVTFNDLYIFKQKVSTQRMMRFANTISHQLAHHWFGNLVTMKWWDDLWLNQSFAQFISHFCLEKIKNNVKTIQYESAMAMFLNEKGWGYDEDQMVTTHPIRGEVPNTSVADSIFDGITYSKGAGTMKQLLFLMKQENFSKALSAYFKKYQWSNATLIDFIAEMKNFYSVQQFSLDEWRQYWLQKASLNQIQALWNPEDKSQHAKITITQTPYTQVYPTLRPHRIKICLFKQDMSIDIIQTLITPQTHNYCNYNGSSNYQAILLNYQDHTFVKNIIDPISLSFFQQNLLKVTDLLSRTLIWKSFFEMVKDAKLRADKYIDIILKLLSNEKSDSIFQTQLEFVITVINVYVPIKYREEQADRMFQFVEGLVKNVDKDQVNRLITLRNKLVGFAISQKSKRKYLNWHQSKLQSLKDHKLTLNQQWSAVAKAFTLKQLTLQEKQAIFSQQQKLDSSDTSKNYRLMCNALKATKEQFQQIYTSFKDPSNQMSITSKNYLANGWNHSYHSQWLIEYKPRYFADIILVAEKLQGDHLEAFYEGLAPIDDQIDGQIEQFEKIKFNNQKFDKNQRDILKIVDGLKRKRNAYKLYQ